MIEFINCSSQEPVKCNIFYEQISHDGYRVDFVRIAAWRPSQAPPGALPQKCTQFGQNAPQLERNDISKFDGRGAANSSRRPQLAARFVSGT